MQIKDKKAIVTGAASGLGLAFSKELLRNGAATIILVDIQETEGKAIAEKLNSEFGKKRAIFLHCDVTKNSEFDATFKEAVNILGGLDILINNAGVVNEQNFAKAVEVNVTAVIRGSLLATQQMGKDTGGKGGVIVNVSSIAGLQAIPNCPIYSTTKHAIIGFSRSFSQPYHYQRTGVRILVLCPELTDISVSENSSTNENFQCPDLIEIEKNIHPQRVENVAHGLVYAIRCAQNGSIWVSEEGKPVYEVQLPDTLPAKTKIEDN
ncbi:15-hydroxyprostaglandin dehydrogenase [NAD(+)]-like [Belonocnema kinseyi]|uniref:15-hydroxyprostaglandin dehydrogenase [NAD(+)]-like n=1 Tax=Belonocnema kinseyi TaxID=2817044 RepID=UPI00143E0818|nr:15-hydroxyprostaglandin dehydrogenase [NAD(+)]-like [Belonocnema kinseyi]